MNENRRYLTVLVLLAAPFYLNDFANIYLADWRWWLLIDYTAVKLFPLLLALWLVRGGRMPPAAFGLVPQPLPAFLATFLITALAGTLIDQNGYRLIEALPGYPELGAMPAITSKVWDWIDLTFGLLMVGVVEELVFRGYLCAFIGRYTRNGAAIVAASCVAFGLIHWSAGLHAVLVTALIGAVFMLVYLRTRSLPAIMLAHFAVDFIDYAGVIPVDWFKLT